MAWYTMNNIAMMTGFTTRTLRNYLRQGLLQGEKVDGVWRFTEEEYEAFLTHPAVKPGIRAKQNAIVNDFLLLNAKKENRTCVILDICTEREDAKRAAEFFCERIKEQEDEELQFGMEWHKKNMRIILSGSEPAVKEIMKCYYAEN
ncbi:MAG: helix-turn-helix domain-containing protein [Lachnospiraceae bacterium]|nr:helix-turn-helix domain-containing protein [Lachnospiraceae bacterium]